MSWSQALGQRGEEFARQMLLKKGLTIWEQRWRSRFGEIDIIALDGDCICFIEVKTRRMDSDFPAEESVDQAKQRRIIRTALVYMGENNLDLQPRFDLFSVLADSHGRIVDYTYWMGAYDSEACTEYI